MNRPNFYSGVSRRRFLAGVGSAAALALLRGSTPAVAAGGAAVDQSLAWRLDSHWGYPVGPRNRTHCECRACRAHALNKVFATEAAAVGARAHTNCVCQARAVQIDAAGYANLFPGGATSTDLRRAGVTALYQSLLIP